MTKAILKAKKERGLTWEAIASAVGSHKVHGASLKEMIYEMFGDGMRSVTDFEIDIQEKPGFLIVS